MSSSSPWDEIAVPGSDFNVRQITGRTAVACFWGRDSTGACLFIAELDGDHTAQFRKHAVTVNGIDVDLRGGETGRQRLVLTLEKHVDRDLFESLCRTLVGSLEHATDSATSVAVAIAHIRRWKAFLSGRSHHLSPEEVRGLFAELSFLMELIERFEDATTAVAAWLGPEKSHQDFIFGNTAVEIKSLSGAERSTVPISSEDQLESLNDSLFLRIYRLSDLSGSAASCSLNQLVANVQSRLETADAIEEFERKLVAHRYAPLPDYDEPRLFVSERRTYRVEEAFPRLVRSALPNGITKTNYEIELEEIDPFACENDLAYGGG